MVMVIDELKKEAIRDMLKLGKRIDGRDFNEYREISIKTNVISTAEGSADVCIGNSRVVAGVKLEVVEPFPDKPDEGTFTVNADLLPTAHETFEEGPPSDDAIELARVVDRGIRAAEAIDLKSLFIEEGKVWGVFVDIYTLDHDGNLFDAAALATTAALNTMKVPRYENGEIIRENMKEMKLLNIPTQCTFAKIGKDIIIDPTYAEEIVADARITYCVGDDMLYAIQKAGYGSFTKEEVISLLDKSFEQRKYLLSLLNKI
ncbi:MAG: exosome complex protein Rrp42 [Candidatus Micrarchaeota archaeon]|nr:exosome complex protein Rrp42 [Candidatus Micrarchaeota archaeon]